MYKLLLIILLIINTLNCLGQIQNTKEILDKLSEKTKSYDNITIKFSFILENKLHDIKEVQNGILEFEKNKFRLLMNDQIIINNGVTQWVYLSESNEVQVIDNDPEENTMNPNYIFTMHEKDYKYEYIESKVIDGVECHIIDLFSNESNNFLKTTLTIEKIKNELKKIRMQDKNGGTYDYIIEEMKVNLSLEPFIFDKKKYPEVDVIDLR